MKRNIILELLRPRQSFINLESYSLHRQLCPAAEPAADEVEHDGSACSTVGRRAACADVQAALSGPLRAAHEELMRAAIQVETALRCIHDLHPLAAPHVPEINTSITQLRARSGAHTILSEQYINHCNRASFVIQK